MRLESSTKKIGAGEFYVKHGQYYVVGKAEERTVLALLSSLLKEGEQHYLVLSGEKAYFFDFRKGRIEVLDREEGRALLYEYPYAIVGEEGQVPLGKVQVKSFIIDRKKVLMTLVLASVFVGLAMVNKAVSDYRKKKEAERIEKEMKALKVVQAKPQLPPCTSNIRSFLELYTFPARVENSMVVYQAGDTTVRVPLRQEESRRVGSRIKVYVPSEELIRRQDESGLVFELKDFGLCLDFIYNNVNLPLSVVSLDLNGGCKININGGCLYEKN